MLNNLNSLLTEHQIDYEILTHEKPIRSAQDGADWFGIDLAQTAPTLILKSGEQQYYALIIAGDYGRVDLDGLSRVLSLNSLRLAKPKEVEKVTGYSVGGVAMIGHGLRTIVDRQLESYDYIYGGTGSPTHTLKIAAADMIRLNDVIAFVREK